MKAQEAIERVYYNHRIWPKENPGPKPPFEQMVPKAQIEGKVTDCLKKSAALDQFWQRPITGEQLQAEMDRMAKGTKDPATLLELFSALDNDPTLIAECLARPLLVDRLIHNWYAYDTRFHEKARLDSERTFQALTAISFESSTAGLSSRITYVLEDGATPREKKRARSAHSPHAPEIPMDQEGFARLLEETPAPGKITQKEDEGAFTLTLCTIKEADQIELVTLSFPKESFDSWWGRERGGMKADLLATIPLQRGYRSTLGSILSAECAEEWTVGNLAQSASSTARSRHTAVWTGSEMIVWGGRNTKYLNSGARYSPATDTWAPVSSGSNCPSVRAAHTAVWTGSEMVIWGGQSESSGPYLNTGGCYDPASDTWTSTSTGADCPLGVANHTAVWTGSEMIIWGGYASPSASNTGGRYNPTTDSWVATSTGANCPSARSQQTAVWTGDEMIVWGGENGSNYLATGGRYSPATDTWQSASLSANPQGRAAHSAVWTGSEMLVWGGQVGPTTYTSTGARYLPSADSWAPISVGANCPSGRRFHSAVWTGSKMIVWGGEGNSNLPTITGGLYDSVTDSWTPTSVGAACPWYRMYPSAIWTGTEMIVWGGELCCFTGYGNRYMNTGGRYNPASNTWVPTAVSPTNRYLHTAVWTGAEMVVWGGYDGKETNTGGRYSPSTDVWLPTSAEGCAIAQYCHAAVWTGTEMLIWGGDYDRYQDDPLVFTGGRYNPVSDLWYSMSESSAPPNRTYSFYDISFSAVWTGTRMIVWGGMDARTFDYLATGGQYDPTSNAWYPVSTGPNCPTARGDHSAVWTGSEMVIWGGWNTDLGDLADGARYSPDTDQWAPMSVGVNCPIGRDSHTAVWTGTEMVVWGGWDTAGNLLDSGAHYDTSSDSWTPMPDGAFRPTGRMLHNTVFTGEEMIVWGGWDTWEPSLNSGGRYNPTIRTWLPTGTGANCPIARVLPSAVWTGAAMIVWGGEMWSGETQDYLLLGDGALYKPFPTIQTLSACAPTMLYAGSGSDYQWYENGIAIPGATSSSYLAATEGSYTVMVGYGGGCTKTSNPYVVSAPPSATISGATAVCPGMGAELSTEAFSEYQWALDGVDIPGATASSYVATIPGAYSVRVTDANGCTGTSPDHTLAIYPTPTPTISGPSPACSSASLNTGSFSSYQWYRNNSPIPGATAQSFFAPAPGTYKVRITDANGCTGTSADFIVRSLPAPSVTGAASGCGFVTLSTGAFASYQWNLNGAPIGGATAQAYEAAVSGNYSVTATDSSGCGGTSAAKAVTVYPPPAPVVTGSHVNMCPQTAVPLSVAAGYSSYQWALNGSPIAGATTQSLLVGVTGSYSVSVTDSNGCVGSSEGFAVFVDFCAGSEVSPAQASFPARLLKDGGSPTGYYLYFQRLDSLNGYNIYEGEIGIYYSHAGAAGNVCSATVEDLITGEMRAAITPSDGNHYYLVTAYSGSAEGPSGFNWLGTEIPASQSTCTP